VEVVRLESVDPGVVDMSTVVLIGSSQTRVLDRPLAASVYTPRTYEEPPAPA
jgi:precorrin-3B methylase